MAALPSYQLNPEGARTATFSQRISETGQYRGRFTRAEAVTAATGATGIEFSFEADDGATADFLTLWTAKDGRDLFGRRQLDAMMACMQLRGIEAKTATIEKWQDGGKASVSAVVFPALMHRPIGLVLQHAEYEKSDRTIGFKMEIYLPFAVGGEHDGKIAAEIMDRKPAGLLPRLCEGLRDRPIQRRATSDFSPPMAPPPTGYGYSNGNGADPHRAGIAALAPAGNAPGVADLDEDIPF